MPPPKAAAPPLGHPSSVPKMSLSMVILGVRDPALLLFGSSLGATSSLSLLHHRQIISSTTCSRCGVFEETVIHCIRDCSSSKAIWQHIGFSDPSFFM